MTNAKDRRQMQRSTVIAVCLGVASIPITVALSGVALDPIRRDLGGDLSTLQWVLNAFLLAYATLPMPLGSIADRRGRRKIFVLGVIGFVVSPILCALSPTIGWLIAARFVQGIAAALIGASCLALLADAHPEPEERKAAFGIMGLAIGIALGVGSAVGGAIIDAVGWRWAFLLQAAVGLAPAFFLRNVPESFDPSGHPIDIPGSLAAFAAVACWMSFGILGPEFGWLTQTNKLLLTGAILFSAVFVMIERRSHSPMIDGTLVTNRGFVLATLICLVFTGALVAVLYFVPLFLQTARGFSSAQAGLLLLVMLVPMAAWPVIVSRTARNVPAFVVLSFGLIIMSAGFMMLGYALEQPSTSMLLVSLAVFGTGCGCISGLVDAVALSALPQHQSGVGTGIFDSLRVIGNSAGAIVSGMLLTVVIAAGPLASAKVDPSAAAGAIISGTLSSSDAHLAYGSAMGVLMRVFAALTLLTAILCVAARRGSASNAALLMPIEN